MIARIYYSHSNFFLAILLQENDLKILRRSGVQCLKNEYIPAYLMCEESIDNSKYEYPAWLRKYDSAHSSVCHRLNNVWYRNLSKSRFKKEITVLGTDSVLIIGPLINVEWIFCADHPWGCYTVVLIDNWQMFSVHTLTAH